MDELVEKALKDLKQGKFVIVADDEARENEGDLILAAEFATEEKMAFMVNHTSGIICVSLTEERLEELQLPQMVASNNEYHHTAFTVSVDGKEEVTTGISAKDRAKTIQTLADPSSSPQDLRRPGHIFPLRCKEGGVLKRAGHTEAAVDLAKLAGLYPAGVLSEIVNEDGTAAKGEQLKKFAEKWELTFITIEDIIRYRRRREKLVEYVSTARMPTRFGEFTAKVYRSKMDQIEHMAIIKGNIAQDSPALVRVHSECLTGDVFGSRRCDCGTQLDLALERISQEGKGVVLYLRGHEGRGIGLGHKLRAYHLQDQGRDTVEANIELGFPADTREYGIGAQILADIGLSKIRLMTNNPAKYNGLSGYDLSIVERVPLVSKSHAENAKYLQTKKEKLGHML